MLHSCVSFLTTCIQRTELAWFTCILCSRSLQAAIIMFAGLHSHQRFDWQRILVHHIQVGRTHLLGFCHCEPWPPPGSWVEPFPTLQRPPTVACHMALSIRSHGMTVSFFQGRKESSSSSYSLSSLLKTFTWLNKTHPIVSLLLNLKSQLICDLNSKSQLIFGCHYLQNPITFALKM